MPYKKYNSANNAFATLATPLADTDVTMILQGKYGRFPTSNFIVKITKTVAGVVTARENVYVATRSGSTCSGLTRAYEPVPVDDAATSNIQQALNFATDDVVEVVPSVEFFKDMQDEISAKLATVAGLRTSFGAGKHVRVNRSTGNEESIAISVGTTPLSTDSIIFEKAGGLYELIPYSAIINDLSGANDRVLIAGEALALNDSLYKEEVLPYSATTTLAPRAAVQKMGDSSANTRIELGKIIGNGGSTNTIKVMVRKVLAPTDNCILRIETDDGTGKPSGTLAHANATALVAGTALTTGFVETTYTAAGNYVLTDLTVYHLIAQRSGAVDASNHYEFAHLTKNVRAFITNTYNGTVWGTPITTKQAYFAISNCYQGVFVKTNATNKDQIGFEGFAKAAAAIGQTVKVASTGLIKSFSGLTTNKAYYLSNTAGLISTTEGTNKVAVGFSDSSSSISIIPFPDGYQDATNWYTIDNIATVNGTTYTRLLRITEYRYIRYTWTGGIYAYFYVNGVSQAKGTSVLCKPGDEVVLVYNSSGGGYPGNITIETSALKNIGIPITV